MKITTVYLTDDQIIKLKDISKKRGGQRVSELIRAGIDMFIEKFEEKEGK